MRCPLPAHKLQQDEDGNYYPSGPELFYDEYLRYYRWLSTPKKWQRRTNIKSDNSTIGRIHMTNPSEGERHFLRRLLLKVKGVISFDDMKKYPKNEKPHPTFKASCRARGLLENDNEWHLTLTEAATYQRGQQLRELFVVILIHCEVSDCLNIWQTHRENLSEDILYNMRKQNYDEEIYQLCLIDIEERLKQYNKTFFFHCQKLPFHIHQSLIH